MLTLKNSLNSISQLLYPRRCVLCDVPLHKNELYSCGSCRPNIKFITGNTCTKCGRILMSRFDFVCPRCLNARHFFDEAAAPFAYGGEIRASIARFKYRGRAEYAEFYAKAIYAYAKKRIEAWGAEVLIPVPVHESRLQKRGYNQAYLIARELEKLTGIPVDNSLVKRIKKTTAQKELTAAQRRSNLEAAFSYISEKSPPKSAIIIDDIFTTGSTANALGGLLRSKGCERIYVLCVSVS